MIALWHQGRGSRAGRGGSGGRAVHRDGGGRGGSGGGKMISLPNCVLNDSHRRDGHVYLLVGNYFSDALGALKPSAAYDKSQQVRAGITT